MKTARSTSAQGVHAIMHPPAGTGVSTNRDPQAHNVDWVVAYAVGLAVARPPMLDAVQALQLAAGAHEGLLDRARIRIRDLTAVDEDVRARAVSILAIASGSAVACG